MQQISLKKLLKQHLAMQKKPKEASVTFLEGDLLQPLIDKDIHVDILVSNPPYIDYDEVLDPRVVDHEPHLALFADDHGYACYENIFKQAPSILKEKAILAFEIDIIKEKE